MFTTSTADFATLRRETLQAHEVAALFAQVAEISGVAESDNETGEATNDEGQSVHAYSSPLSLWELKRGLITPATPKERSLWSRLKWGVCAQACEEMGVEMRKPEGVAISDAHPFLSSRVDMEVSEDFGSTWIPMIAKNIANTQMDMWRNATGEWIVPEAVLLECQHHCLVRGAAKVHVAALFGGTTVRRFVVERDDELLQMMVEGITSFWSCVTTGRRPGSTSKHDTKIIARLNGVIDPTEEIADFRGDSSIEKAIALKQALNAEIKERQAKIEEIDIELRARMDGKGAALISDTHQIRWIRTAAQTVSYEKPAGAYLKVTKIAARAAGTPLAKLAEQEG